MTPVIDESITKWSFRQRKNRAATAYSTLKQTALRLVSAGLMVNKTFFLINGAEIFLKNRILLLWKKKPWTIQGFFFF